MEIYSVPDNIIHELISLTETTFYLPSQMILHHGEVFDHFYMIKEGDVR